MFLKLCTLSGHLLKVIILYLHEKLIRVTEMEENKGEIQTQRNKEGQTSK